MAASSGYKSRAASNIHRHRQRLQPRWSPCQLLRSPKNKKKVHERHENIYFKKNPDFVSIKINSLEFHFMESLKKIQLVEKFEFYLNFCAHSARLLRKPNHVLLWILRNDTDLSIVKKIATTSNVLPLHFAPSKASSRQNSNGYTYF